MQRVSICCAVNVEQLGPDNVVVVSGEAPDALDALPAPDCVFVGGNGGRLADILECAVSRLKADGRIVVNLASIERVVQTQASLESLGFDAEGDDDKRFAWQSAA